jgi:hypothetical protein
VFFVTVACIVEPCRGRSIRVWRLPAEGLLTGGLGTPPLAPLSDVRQEDLPQVVRRMQ